MHYRRVVRDCPVCGITDSAFLIAWHTNPWYASSGPAPAALGTFCTNCGDAWREGELLERPFRRGWRQEAIARAVNLWEQACECPLDRDADLYIQPCEHERKPGAVPHAG